ncbi:hypothetical protein CCR75_004571 [Bremia lactucae]|uniref:DUF7492 domain-containing protein n=1 Tax=Bremia lactucae TaxID=4779 RepID=A0A976IHV0_BRELC|nr:hypothetical protein CCR75_004571 [Bremia lactucae]
MVTVVSLRRTFFPLVLLLNTRHVVKGHAWIDCFEKDWNKIYDQSASYIFGGAGGNGFCSGYGAGYPGRGDHGIGPGYTHKMLQNEVEAGVPVCQTVDPNTYSDWRKRLSMAPGETTFFAYLPNGHIVKDKKGVGTQHGIYWTGKPGTSLSTTREMKPEHLINGHTMNFDDGNCGETVDFNNVPSGRAGDGKPCIGSFMIPPGTAPGIYKMVWYWTFWLNNESAYKDQNMAKGYFGAAYSTCFEVEVTSGGAQAPNPAPQAPNPAPQAPNPAPQAPNPAPQAPIPASPSCTQTVAPGDAANGIGIMTDTNCKSGGLGCINYICRYCQVTMTDKSAPFPQCSSAPGPGTVVPAWK